MRQSLKRLVRQRAAERCEYCHLPSSAAFVEFEIDHIIARKHDGPTTADNLALACVYCNESKGTDIASLDPVTGNLVRLFHPRLHRWSDHFHWNGPQIIGQTDVGRATVRMLRMNEPGLIALRQLLVEEGLLELS